LEESLKLVARVLAWTESIVLATSSSLFYSVLLNVVVFYSSMTTFLLFPPPSTVTGRLFPLPYRKADYD
jgi:hypothetical protein